MSNESNESKLECLVYILVALIVFAHTGWVTP